MPPNIYDAKEASTTVRFSLIRNLRNLNYSKNQMKKKVFQFTVSAVQRRMKFLAGIATLLLPWLIMPEDVKAQLVICSRKNNHHLDVAVGYRKNGAWFSEGWWRIPPSGCVTPIGGDLRNKYYYIRAVEWETRKTWEQRYAFCTDTSAFAILGDKDCESRGYNSEYFYEHDCGSRNYCQVNIWPEKISFSPSLVDDVIAQRQLELLQAKDVPSRDILAR